MSLRPDDHRRKWDKAEYQKLAQDRLRKPTKSEEKDDGN